MALVFTTPVGVTPLRNQDAGSAVTVDLGGGLIYGVDVENAAWELHKPWNSSAFLSPGVGDVAQSFTPDVPGRYLVRVVMDLIPGPSTTTFTVLFEVEDAYVKDHAIPAATETSEANIPSNEGWGTEMAERVYRLGKSAYGFTETIMVYNPSGAPIPAGTPVAIVINPILPWMGPTGTVIVTPPDHILAASPAFGTSDPGGFQGVTLETLDASGGRGYVQLKGLMVFDTSAWSPGNRVYVGNAGVLDNAPGDYPVLVGFVMAVGLGSGTTPGLIFLFGGWQSSWAWDWPPDIHTPSSSAAIWADGLGSGNDINVFDAEMLTPGGAHRWIARRYECGTNGHHLAQVWHILVSDPRLSTLVQRTTDPFIRVYYQLDQVGAQVSVTVLESSNTVATLFNKVGSDTTGNRAVVEITWADVVALTLDGSLGSLSGPQYLEVRAEVTLALALDIGYVGGCDVLWCGNV